MLNVKINLVLEQEAHSLFGGASVPDAVLLLLMTDQNDK